MKDLTPHQKEIWDMKRPLAEGGEGLSAKQIGKRLDISPNNVQKTLGVIHKKVGYKPTVRPDATEIRNPEAAGALLADLSDPIGTNFAQIAELYGIQRSVLQGMVKRMQARQGTFISQVRDLRTLELREVIGQKIHHFLQYIDDKVLSEASARDLAMGVSQLIEKRALLRGEPTAIVSNLERETLHKLLPALVAEGVRRGLALDDVKDVTP